METIRVNVKDYPYDVIIGENLLSEINNFIDHKGKVLIISDDGIPYDYVTRVFSCFKQAYVKIFKKGEINKSLNTYTEIMNVLLVNNFDRHDAIIALGGGLTSDLAGFVAATYMRGIKFYVIPTTVLSQVDASIGGKVAVNFHGYKNLIGNFYQPAKVIIDTNTLLSLDKRLYSEGFAEVIKMAAIFDEEFFTSLEKDNLQIDEIIYRSLLIKKNVVELDEKEKGLRKILNFGHTIGHAIESLSNGKLLHGEAVAIGMLYCSEGEARERLMNLLQRYNLPINDDYSTEAIMKMLPHDKKKSGDFISVILCKRIGEYEIKDLALEEIEDLIRRNKDEKLIG